MTQTIAKTIARGFAVKTKFLGPTNYRGSRVCATYKRGSEQTYRATVDWDHRCDAEQNHARAAQTLINKLNADRAAQFAESGSGAIAEPFEIVATGFDQENYYFLAGHAG